MNNRGVLLPKYLVTVSDPERERVVTGPHAYNKADQMERYVRGFVKRYPDYFVTVMGLSVDCDYSLQRVVTRRYQRQMAAWDVKQLIARMQPTLGSNLRVGIGAVEDIAPSKIYYLPYENKTDHWHHLLDAAFYHELTQWVQMHDGWFDILADSEGKHWIYFYRKVQEDAQAH